jgi:hypothetical protein
LHPIVRALVIVAAVLWVSACHEPTRSTPLMFVPQWSLELGQIEVGDPHEPIAVPDSAATGADFVVSLWTSNGGAACYIREGNTQVTMPDSATAEIRPYDEVIVNTDQCDEVGRLVQHLAAVRFGQPGIATVRLIGQSGDSTLTITRTVVIH